VIVLGFFFLLNLSPNETEQRKKIKKVKAKLFHKLIWILILQNEIQTTRK
jgi:hypothetical protein